MTALTNATRQMMTTSITTNKTASWLLANREKLSLETATAYLAGRMRTRTPLGASETLLMLTHQAVPEEHRRELVDNRALLAATKMDLYRDLFPLQYKASQSPAFSVQRERELYTLIDKHLFHIDMTGLNADDPRAFLPFIPISGEQNHDWEEGCCAFETLQTCFKLALVLSGRKPGGWRHLGLEKEPAPPLDALAWTLFVYSLAVEASPLRYLKHAFDETCYTTGNVWLDLPRSAGPAGMRWSAESIAELFLARMEASRINTDLLELNMWLASDPRPRIARAVELWNAAALAAARPDGRHVYVGPDGRQILV